MSYLQLQNLSKRYGDTTVVKDVNISVQQGQLVTLLGPSGCGKTTVLRMIAGFVPVDEGNIILGDRAISSLPPNQRDVGMVFQSYALFPNLTAAENIAFGLKLRKMNRGEMQAKVEKMLNFTGLSEVARHRPAQLSGGQQQRVALARALVLEPRLLLLDEPFSALDAKIRANLRQLVREIQQRLQITTVFVTHDQEEALAISDRIVVMEKGRVAQMGTPPEIYRNPANLFVAKFVGLLNLIPAVVVEPATGVIRVKDFELKLNRPIHGAQGSMVQVAVRPETVKVKLADNSRNEFSGILQNIVMLGNIIRLEVHIQDQLITVDLLNRASRDAFHKGETVALEIPAEACFIVA